MASKWYICIKKPGHPRANKGGYVKRAVLVVEEQIGRYLSPNEEVHHINRIRSDDRLENLQLITHAEHAKVHGFYNYNHAPRNTKGHPFYGNQYINQPLKDRK